MNKALYIKTLIILCSVIIHSSVVAQGQIGNPPESNPIQTQPRGRNIISCSAYNSITYNGHTIQQINATGGSISGIQSLWGSYTSVTNNDTSWERLFKFESNNVAFNTEFGQLTNIKITNSQWPLSVLGKEIRVGDSFEDMNQKFGSNLKIIYKPEIDPNYVVTFNCSGNDGDGLLIDFSTSTDQVVDIVYFLNP